tara:strand:- start:942 stop:1595 length:654 start_codon:yes stop_codon:yes gene_type:complete
MRIFIGHDSRYKDATKVCEKSIKNYWPEADITWLDKAKLKEMNVYGRKDVEGESTEFSFTRFYVPLLCNYKGIAMFCDNDFLWKGDPRLIRRYVNLNQPMAVVKHEDYAVENNKMNGVQNKSYPKKNWSSLMLFRCDHFKNKLTKEYLDNATPAQLHEFHFINEDNIGSIPKDFNCLVGHYDCDNAKALHYTNGGPWFEEYALGDLAEEWWKVYESL